MLNVAPLTDRQVDELDEASVRELEDLYREEEKAQRYDLFRNLFPDTGPLAYRNYPKHMEFFRAGASYPERCFMAANRVGKCRLYNDLVPHPDGSVSRIGDLFVSGRPFDVMAWDGEKAVAVRASHVIRKPPELAVELLLASGDRFTCSLDHRVLTDAGWRNVRHLLGSVPCLPRSTAAPDPLTRAGGGQHWSQTIQDWRARCLSDSRRYDAQLLDRVTLSRALARQRVDVPRHTPVSSASGSPARTGRDTPSAASCHLSSPGGRLRCLVRSVAFSAQAAYTFARHSTGSHPGCGPLRAAASALVQSIRGVAQGLAGPVALVAPSSKATNRVVAYREVGVHALYDMTVPGFHNYIADGIVHHNTLAGAFEVTCHATGTYPTWWQGRRFYGPVKIWAAGDSNETTRDVIQKKLFGGIDYLGVNKTVDGAGMVPRDAIVRDDITWKSGVPDLIDTVKIRHRLGGLSVLGLKSYAQGRRAFQGTEQDVIWCDEEPPLEVYTEMLIRTMTTGGMTMLTYTPLEGLTGVVLSFLPEELRPPDDVIASLG